VPQDWLTPEARHRARIPPSIRFQEKWRLALTLLRQIRAAGFQLTAVLGDAEFGDNATLRRTLHRFKLPYALGISSTLTVFRGTPRVAVPRGHTGAAAAHAAPTRRRESTRSGAGDRRALPARAWRRVSWRNGTHRPWAAHFAALAGHSAHEWRGHRLAPEVCCSSNGSRRHAAGQGVPRRAAVHRVAPLAGPLGPSSMGDRTAIRGTERRARARSLRGRSFVGWHRHVVLTAMAYSWLQDARRRAHARLPTLPVARAVITEILTAHFL